ncbi:MAG: FAD-dependent oxidoreductase [Gemmatimonadales bacterium]|nr:FAD-dependent oxidoreductase [Gemmatimonadales bacterium]
MILPRGPDAGGRLLLVGGGHAHLFVLEGLGRGRFPAGVQATLVAPERLHPYSGMVPGLIGGRYRPEEVVFDLETLARWAGARFVQGSAAGIDLTAEAIELESGERLPYDIVSFAVGAGPSGTSIPGVGAAVPVKPIERTLKVGPELARAVEQVRGRQVEIVVVGGGAAGVEIAFNLRARHRLLSSAPARITIVDGHPHLLRDRSAATAKLARRALNESAIGLRLGSEVAEVRDGAVRLAGGDELPADLTIWATGASAPALFSRAGLATDGDGFVLVDQTLRSVSHPAVFAAGDAATLKRYPDTPKAGVYAVRQGALLCDNLAAALRGTPGSSRAYRPQRRFLALLNTGDGSAILSYGPVALWARWAMVLKDRIDRRFMARFRRAAE